MADLFNKYIDANPTQKDCNVIFDNSTKEYSNDTLDSCLIQVQANPTKNNNLTDFGKVVLKDRYLLNNESYQDLFVRVAKAYSDNASHAERLYDYFSNLYAMPSTPILSNGGTERGLPISCFLNEPLDSLQGIADIWNENVWLAAKGGGIGSYWGGVRSIGEQVGHNKGHNGSTSGIIPFIKVMDSQTLAISQGSLRRGSAAVYLQVEHPEIEEFIDIRRPTGGDYNRRSLNLHHAVVLSDKFMKAVEQGKDWELISPASGNVIRIVDARALWIKILTTRVETGEPYILFIDTVNNNLPEIQKILGLKVKASNLCSEITLPTGLDHLGNSRTAVCCLSSLNLEYFEEWQDSTIIEDMVRFLDNVLQDFIDKAPDTMQKAKYSAEKERSIGLGVMGFHSFLQKKMVPFESVIAKSWNKKIFSHINQKCDEASRKLVAEGKKPCPDAIDASKKDSTKDSDKYKVRFSNVTAIAPTASISIICGNTSPGIEPYRANSYTQKTLTGSFSVKNKFLKQLLEKKGKDNKEVWSSITVQEGSVQHLDFLDEHEKSVFKTAIELDQRWVVDLAADRTPYISQAQSVNIFLPADVHKKDLHEIHFRSWKKGLKSLYYCRSVSIGRAEKVSDTISDSDKNEQVVQQNNMMNKNDAEKNNQKEKNLQSQTENTKQNNIKNIENLTDTINIVTTDIVTKSNVTQNITMIDTQTNDNQYEECLACQ